MPPLPERSAPCSCTCTALLCCCRTDEQHASHTHTHEKDAGLPGHTSQLAHCRAASCAAAACWCHCSHCCSSGSSRTGDSGVVRKSSICRAVPVQTQRHDSASQHRIGWGSGTARLQVCCYTQTACAGATIMLCHGPTDSACGDCLRAAPGCCVSHGMSR